MAIHVLIINRQLSIAVSLKQGLERTGKFQARPFTSVDAALDYLKDHPQDVALVDFTGISGRQIVEQLRAVQSNLPIIASPTLPESESLALNLQGTLDAPYKTHEVITLIGKAAEQTRKVSGQHQEMESVLPTSVLPQTRLLDDDTLDQPVQTSQLGPPTKLPEFSSLDSVLANMADAGLFEPASQSGDTPSIPFESIADSLDPSATIEELKRPDSHTFDELVNSMRSPEAPRSVRDQQYVEFTLTGGMESLLSEIERSKETPVAPEQPAGSFERLAAEEPPLPTLEESGTVGDLMLGVSDNSFRNVLSLLRGEKVSEAEPERPPSAPGISHEEMAEAFASFYEQQAGESEPPATLEPEKPSGAASPYDFGSEDEAKPPENTPAKVILTSALDDTRPFSLDDLIKGIERQLPVHRPNVRPLPSWKEQLPLRTSPDEDRYVREPDFLPEELPPALESMDTTGHFADQTTRGPLQETAGPSPQDFETELMRLFDQPVASPPPHTLPETPAPMPPTISQEPEPPIAVSDKSGEEKTFTPQAEEESLTEAEFLPETQFATPEEVVEEVGYPSPEEPSRDFAFENREPQDLPETAWDKEDTEPFAAPLIEEEQAEESETPPFTLADGEEEAPHDSELAFGNDFEKLAAFEFAGDENLEQTPVLPMAALENPYIAQLALSLTQVSLELTAESTLLTREDEIVAFAGRLSREDIEELRGVIGNDWDADPEQARIRFVTLPSSGKDYMLYSRATVEDLTLSMIFAGTRPLRDIRRQSKRLIEALVAVPENPPAPEKPVERSQPSTPSPPGREDEMYDQRSFQTPTESQPTERIAIVKTPETANVGPLTSYTYVWLLRDPNAHLNSEVSQAIAAGLQVQLVERAWQVKSLEAREDYVYVVADVPGEAPASQIVRELKRRAGDIAHAQNTELDPTHLWSDSYLIVTPGRELAVEEIQQFINFERM